MVVQVKNMNTTGRKYVLGTIRDVQPDDYL
jgi:hypothetical protein